MDGWMTFWFYDVNTVLTINWQFPALAFFLCLNLIVIPKHSVNCLLILRIVEHSIARACSALSLLFLFLFLPPFLAQKGTISSSCFIESNCDQWWRFVQVVRQRTCVHKYMLNTCNYIYIWYSTIMLYHLFVYAHFMFFSLVWYEYYIYLLRVAQWPFTLGLRMRLENWFRSWQWSHQRHGKLKVMRKQLIQMFEVGDDCGWFREGSRWF